MRIGLNWYAVAEDDDPRWSYSRALYAYLAPSQPEIVYIGKADGCTVRQRWQQKWQFWMDLERDRKIKSHRVIVAELELPMEYRMTRQLLADIESLLIYEVKPWGNIQAQSSRITRPGLRVECRRAWPCRKRVFQDS
jgi:hypothetical protein